MCSHRATRMTRRSYTVLAALLLADGEWVSRQELAANLFDWPISREWLSNMLATIDQYVGVVVERRWRLGYRLMVLPPDEHLESILACVPGVKRSDWWRGLDSQIRMTA